MQKIIFDCDNTMGLPTKEIDDGLTLYYLLGREDIDLLGITTTFGNGTIDQVYPQTVELAAGLGRADLPVLEGAGERGQPPTEAARYLAETAAKHPGEITVLATGPLGNLRAAFQLDPEFFGNLKAVCCMGGYLSPVKVGRRSVGELNLSADPEASHLILNAACEVVLMNAQICLQAPFRWRDYSQLDFWTRKTRKQVRNWLVLHALFCGIPNFYLWDLLPAVYISYPELFDQNLVAIQSTVGDLENGTLRVQEPGGGRGVHMPSMIMDFDRFRDILFTAWRRVKV